MFARLARATFAGRRHRPAMPAQPAYANDNHIKDAAAARSHGNRPRLECRWHRSPITGRLECHWGLEEEAADPANEPGPSWAEAGQVMTDSAIMPRFPYQSGAILSIAPPHAPAGHPRLRSSNRCVDFFDMWPRGHRSADGFARLEDWKFRDGTKATCP
jgi:hypothetical protein